MRNIRNRSLVLFAALALLAVGISGCSSSDTSAPVTPTPKPASSPGKQAPTPQASGQTLPSEQQQFLDKEQSGGGQQSQPTIK